MDVSRRGLLEGALVFAALAAMMPCPLAAQSNPASDLDGEKLARYQRGRLAVAVREPHP